MPSSTSNARPGQGGAHPGEFKAADSQAGARGHERLRAIEPCQNRGEVNP
jgi:hypothetical protein